MTETLLFWLFIAGFGVVLGCLMLIALFMWRAPQSTKAEELSNLDRADFQHRPWGKCGRDIHGAPCDREVAHGGDHWPSLADAARLEEDALPRHPFRNP